MEVKELLTQIQQQYNAWKLERDQEEIVTDISDVQQFLAAYMYDYVIEFVKDVKNLQSFTVGIYELEKQFSLGVSLSRYKSIFEYLDLLEEPFRTGRLSALMSEMEREFNIPMLNNEQFNRENIGVMELYWSISSDRDL
ncbi:hypothetical protein I6G82_02930 [Lysinibacillus macroides]|uniref:Uncharacterized protein n=1 Tax=Lysinibacillus macroides TaxID=33935 RepID=A0A0M9DIF1_9BACI|nr:hypothetical protein [Lysinibacillus macroides]KOY81243.1 hypothetical protein ADM90_19055 [Lysinibacillus macroides]QPR68603.1 hypothetical protein I6G82_02930 [Lysinibacillus macroides]